MKRLSTIVATATLASAFAVPALAGPVGISGYESNSSAQPEAEAMAQLEKAAQENQWESRQTKFNREFYRTERQINELIQVRTRGGFCPSHRKERQINELIQRLKSGQKVAPEEIDQALEPAQVW
jgi:hypothetical protein